MTPETVSALDRLRWRILERYGVDVLRLRPPRPQSDVPIPDRAGAKENSLSFGVLIEAQALGDRARSDRRRAAGAAERVGRQPSRRTRQARVGHALME